MLNPDSVAFQRASEVVATGAMTGDRRPQARITVSKNGIRGHLSQSQGGIYRNVLFEQPHDREPVITIKSIEISRSIDDDGASCTLSLVNDDPRSTSPQGLDTSGRPGYWTPGRGVDKPAIRQSSILDAVDPDGDYPTDWEYPELDPHGLENTPTEGDLRMRYDWAFLKNLFLPNRVIKTYQGYGSDNLDENGEQRLPDDPLYVAPREDSLLIQTGVWLINRVTIGQDGYVNLECSDLAKVLIKQFVYPPMLPLERFPLTYCPIHEESGEKGGIGKDVAGGYHSSSNDPWYGRGAAVYGHTPQHAFDGRPDTYWLSVGNSGATRDYAFEWIQTSAGGDEINEVVLNLKGGNYVIYVSVMENGTWQGTETVPYNPNARPAFPNGADIKYVSRVTSSNLPKDPQGGPGFLTIKLPRTYKATHVRVCFTNLWDSDLGPYQYRAAVREFRCRWNRPDTYEPSNKGEPGAIDSWAEAVKELLAWSGFTWYANPLYYGDVPPDPLLGRDAKTSVPLRVWGDFERVPAPKECSAPDQFLNKSFMEAINTIKDWLGCIFFIDESGGAVFRLPNIYDGGNFVHDPTATTDRLFLRREWPIEIHENANLVDYSLVFDDSELRSEILVIGGYPDQVGATEANSPPLGGVLLQEGVAGLDDRAPTSEIDLSEVLAGQYRLMVPPGDDTKGFTTEEECQRMAELTALFILFTYRRGDVSAPAHPGLQLDDQIRVFNRITNETNVQYVSGISTSMDLDEGIYTMDVSVHWLGGDPDSDWFFDRYNVTPAMLSYPSVVKRLGST